jgi:uncharacterized membrane protein YecN with MAPEG domain
MANVGQARARMIRVGGDAGVFRIVFRYNESLCAIPAFIWAEPIMTLEQLETWGMYLCGGGLILFMFFIVWDLAKKSKAGKFGTFVLFGVLGFAIMVFVIKEIFVHILA